MISNRHGFIFIHIPKTAGNTIQEALLPYSDDEKTTAHHQDGTERFGISGAITPRKHAMLLDYERALGRQELTRFIKFCVIRNPWDRAISNYLSPHRWMERRGAEYVQMPPKWDEERFVELLADMKPAIAYMKNSRGEPEIDHVIHFERLVEDFRSICSLLNIADVTDDLRHRNRAATDFDRGQFYRSPRAVKAVADTMAEDIARWHYKPEWP